MKKLFILFAAFLSTVDRASLSLETRIENKWFNLLDRYFVAKGSYVITLALVLIMAALVVYLQAVHAESLIPSKK